MPPQKIESAFSSCSPWLSHVRDEPREGTTTFEKMIPCRSKTQTQPPGAGALPLFKSAGAQQIN